MIGKEFCKAGHTPTLFAAFFYFDTAFMVLGPLGVQIAADVGLNAGQKGLMVALPILAGALLRVPNGVFGRTTSSKSFTGGWRAAPTPSPSVRSIQFRGYPSSRFAQCRSRKSSRRLKHRLILSSRRI